MSISITVDSTTPTAELDAIAVLIAALGGRAGRVVTAMYEELQSLPETLPVDPRPTPAPSPVSGAASAPSTSAMDRGAQAQAAARQPSTEELRQMVSNQSVVITPKSTVPAVPAVLPSVSIPLPPVVPVPPAPVAVVPPPPAGNTVVSASPVPLDGEGLPWDERIHSGNREMTAKGVWRRRKNTPDDRWDAVRAELKQVMGATGVPTPLEAHIANDAAQYTDAPTEAARAFAPTIPVPPTPPAAVPAPPPADTASGVPDVTDAINGFLMRLTEAQMAGTISIEQVQAAAVGVGLTSVRDVRNRPDLIAGIEAALGMGA